MRAPSAPASLVDVAWLSSHLGDEGLRVVDCARDAAAYRRAHVPGSVLRPGHAYLKAAQRTRDEARSPHLPDEADMARLCGDMGIGPGTTVVAYDDRGSLFATRLRWALRVYGFERVHVLDGGWQAWVAEGLPISAEVTVPESVPLPPLSRVDAGVATLRDVLAGIGVTQILDVRTGPEHRGDDDRGNARAGRIPGAKHLEWTRFLDHSDDAEAVRTFRSLPETQALVDEVGLDPMRPVVTYCQAGVRASLAAFALERLGFTRVRVYDGSMEEWANRRDTPMERS